MAEPKFEKDLDKLEKIVESLEGGGLPLDDSLKKFEEGIKLSKRCEQALSAAEKKIEVLTKNAQGQVKAKPFGDSKEPGTARAAGGDDEEEGDDDDEEDAAGGADSADHAGGDGDDGDGDEGMLF